MLYRRAKRDAISNMVNGVKNILIADRCAELGPAYGEAVVSGEDGAGAAGA
jgi:hypothetical protein